MTTRSQLTLFVPPEPGVRIEAVRRLADPIQHRLIPAHVTLCREDELHGLDVAALRARLDPARVGPVTLEFGPAERFGTHGLLLPCVEGADAFQALRAVVLAVTHPRPHAPHLTLAHPRNPRAPDNDPHAAAPLPAGLRVTFDTVSLIDQVDDTPWVVRGSVPLRP